MSGFSGTVYHGSHVEGIKTFNLGGGVFGRAVYFAFLPELALKYAKQKWIYTVHIDVKNSFECEKQYCLYTAARELKYNPKIMKIREHMLSIGYDSVILTSDSGEREIALFNPEQATVLGCVKILS